MLSKKNNTKHQAIPEELVIQAMKLAKLKGFELVSFDDTLGYNASKKLLFVSPTSILEKVTMEMINTWGNDITFNDIPMYVIDSNNKIIIQTKTTDSEQTEMPFL